VTAEERVLAESADRGRPSEAPELGRHDASIDRPSLEVDIGLEAGAGASVKRGVEAVSREAALPGGAAAGEIDRRREARGQARPPKGVPPVVCGAEVQDRQALLALRGRDGAQVDALVPDAYFQPQ